MNKRILICEDEKETRELLRDILKRYSDEIHLVADGKEAVDKVKQIKPDLILLDIRMPKLDGIEAAKRIRKFDTKAKIIFVTGFNSRELTREAAKYDIFDYIIKSDSTQSILQAISKALED